MHASNGCTAVTRGSLHRRVETALMALCLCVAIPLAARGENSETTALRREVSDLKQVVQHLSERVEGLEKQLLPRSASDPQAAAAPETPVPLVSAPATPAPRGAAPATPGDSIRNHWRQISRGMTTQEVETLLGRPQRTMNVNLRTVWYYTYPEVGSGSVVFAPEGGVDDWQTPPFNTWW